MVRPDISWSVNAYWHSIIQKNCRERLKKISTDGRAALASRATSAGTRRLWGKKLLLVHLGGGGGSLRGVFSFADLDYLRLGY